MSSRCTTNGGHFADRQVELQLRDDAARTATVDIVEAQVRESFHSGPKGSPYLRRVVVYGDGRLIAEWVRTEANAIIRTFP